MKKMILILVTATLGFVIGCAESEPYNVESDLPPEAIHESSPDGASEGS